MRLQELFERVHLPLNRNLMPHARGRYGAFIVTMDPRDFIRLTTTNDASYEEIFTDTKVDLDTFTSGTDPDFNRTMYSMPFLEVQYPSGRVRSHEGRHRAAMVAKAGGSSFPVLIIFKAPLHYVLTYMKHDYTDWDGESEVPKTRHEEEFSNWRQAKAREDELRAVSEKGDTRYFFSDYRTEDVGGGTMKGSPRSPAYTGGDSWTYSPWMISDMPEQLIGQFNKDFVLPKAKMKIGLVKGFRHHRA